MYLPIVDAATVFPEPESPLKIIQLFSRDLIESLKARSAMYPGTGGAARRPNFDIFKTVLIGESDEKAAFEAADAVR